MDDGGQHHVHDVGRIIMDVEKELAGLKDSLLGSLGPAVRDDATVAKVDDIIAKAQKELQRKAELVLNTAMSKRVEQMPFVGAASTNGRVTVKTLSERRALAAQQEEQNQQESNQRMKEHVEALVNNYHKKDSEACSNAAAQHTHGCHRATRKQQNRRRPLPSSLSRLRRSNELDNTKNYAAQNELLDQVDEGKQLSVLEMMNRGIVPPVQDVSAAFTSGSSPAMTQNRVSMYQSEARTKRKHEVSLLGDGQDPMIKFDMNDRSGEAVIEKRRMASSQSLRPHHGSIGAVAAELPRSDVGGKNTPVVNEREEKMPERHESSASAVLEGPPEMESLGKTVETIRGYDDVVEHRDLYVFIIRDGKTAVRSSEFISFRKKYQYCWGAIAARIEKAERILKTFSVPLAYVDGQKLALLANDELVELTVDNFVTCVRNRDQVQALISLPGRRFAEDSPEARDRAAVVIQSQARAYLTRKHYLQERRRDAAATCIQRRFHVHSLKRICHTRLEGLRADDEATFAGLQAQFGKEWSKLREQKRVVVHVPSRSFVEQMRLPVRRLKLLENLQMSRIADLADPNVTVVYVAPFVVPHDVIEYYEKLLGVAGIPSASSRLKFVCPENADRFPEHFSLSTVLYYSPRAMKRIRRICGDHSKAYIVPGQMGEEDKTLATALNLPILGPSPEIAAFYGSKSGTKRLFSDARVSVPPGAHDLYEYHDVISTLAKLVAANLDVQHWLLKIDDEHSGRGHALVDIGRLPAVTELRRERQRQAQKSALKKAYWARSEVQEAARSKLEIALKAGLQSVSKICAPDLYPSWKKYMSRFVRVGGVIEAVPDNIAGSPSANLCIEPDGSIKLISVQDQIFTKHNPYQYAGASFPQKSCPHMVLRQAATAISRSLHNNGVIGYVGIDFVVSHDRNVDALRLWAVDVNLRMTNSCAAFKFFNFLMGGGGMDMRSGEFFARITQNSRKTSREQSEAVDSSSNCSSEESRPSSNLSIDEEKGEEKDDRDYESDVQSSALEPRCFVTFDTLSHPNLSSSAYGSFFNVCRLHGVSFDLHSMMGTAFNLYDTLGSGLIGAMSIASSQAEACKQMRRSLHFIHSQAGGFVTRRRLGGKDSALLEDNSAVPQWDGTCSFVDAIAVAKTWKLD